MRRFRVYVERPTVEALLTRICDVFMYFPILPQYHNPLAKVSPAYKNMLLWGIQQQLTVCSLM